MVFKKLKMGIWFFCGFAMIMLFCSLPLKHLVENHVTVLISAGISFIVIPIYTYFKRRKNPFIFRQLAHFMETGQKCEKPTPQQIKDTIVKHATLSVAYKGEYSAIREMRKHIAWYSAGYPNSSRFRAEMNEMETMEDILAIMEKVFV